VPATEPSPILAAISEELRRLEAAAARLGPIDEQEALQLYELIADARDALERLAEAVEKLER